MNLKQYLCRIFCREVYNLVEKRELDIAKLNGIIADLRKVNIYKSEILKSANRNMIYYVVNKTLKTDRIVMTDDVYYLTSKEEMEKLLKSDTIDKRKWTKDTFDCDDYSAHLYNLIKPYAGFIVDCSIMTINVRHSLNGFVDNNFNVYLIEGETDNIYNAKDYRFKGHRINFDNENDFIRI